MQVSPEDSLQEQAEEENQENLVKAEKMAEEKNVAEVKRVM